MRRVFLGVPGGRALSGYFLVRRRSYDPMLDVGRLLAIYRNWTPARDLSEFGVFVYRVEHPAPLFSLRSLPPYNAHSSSPQQVL